MSANGRFNPSSLRSRRPSCVRRSLLLSTALLAITSYSARAQRSPIRRSGKSFPLRVAIVGSPRWWVEPLDQERPVDGHLYFETIVVNHSDHELTVGAIFRAYRVDGTPIPGCATGESALVRPEEKAALFCTSIEAPLSLKDLQVTARLRAVAYPEAIKSTVVKSSNVALDHLPSNLFDSSAYTASSLLHVTGRDSHASVLFRFYDEHHIQIGTCESSAVVIQPEVAVKAKCSSPLVLPKAVAAPASVTAEVRSAPWLGSR